MAAFDFSTGETALHDAMTSAMGYVPFTAQMHEFAMRESGIPGHDFYTHAGHFVRAICEITERFDFDTPSFIWDVYNIEAEALGCPLLTFTDMAPAIENSSPLVSSEKDLVRLKPPNPTSSGRMPMVFEIMQEIKIQAGMTAFPCYCAPFTLASHIMTFENLIVQIKQNPSFVHRVLTFLVDEVLAPFVNALFREFPDAPFADGSDAVASLPFITQDMLDEFALAYIERLQKQTIRPVVCDNWWGDSYTTDLPAFWSQKLRATPGYLKVQDPDLFKIGVDPVIKYAKEHDLPVVLGIDNNLLQSGTANDIGMRIHEYMEAIDEVGKGALYLCSLSAITPVENVTTAISAINQYRTGEKPWEGLYQSGKGKAGHPVEDNKSVSTSPKSSPEKESLEEDEEELLDDIFEAVMEQDEDEVVRTVGESMDRKMDVHTVLDEGLIAAMDEVGEAFSSGSIFVPEMLLAARAMKSGLEVIRPVLTQTGAKPKGKVLLATVQGDVHDIGKNLVGMMLEGAGYEVIDIGINKTPEEILDSANELNPDVVALSSLLTTSMPSMQKTVELFKKMNSIYPVIVGGAPVTLEFANAIQADGYGENAPLAVESVHRIVCIKQSSEMPT